MHHRTALALTTAAVLTGTAAATVVVPAIADGGALSPEQAAVLENPQVATPDASNAPRDARGVAAEAVHRWFENEGVDGPEDMVYPFNLITGWEATRANEITLHVSNEIAHNTKGLHEYDPDAQLHTIAQLMMTKIGPYYPELDEIRAASEDGEHVASYPNHAQAARGTAEAKAAAIDAGRPEPAWDKNCIAWSLDDNTEGEQARAVAAAWLDSHNAECPDQILHPGYYVEDFTATGPGAVSVTLDDEALADYFVNPYSDAGLQHMGFLIMGPTRWDVPELETLTVTIEGTDRAWTVTPEQTERGVITAPHPPHVGENTNR